MRELRDRTHTTLDEMPCILPHVRLVVPFCGLFLPEGSQFLLECEKLQFFHELHDTGTIERLVTGLRLRLAFSYEVRRTLEVHVGDFEQRRDPVEETLDVGRHHVMGLV